jgi:hypothetical protein
MSSAPWVWLMTTFIYKNETSALDYYANLVQHWWTISINTTRNLVKWDYINIWFDNSSNDNLEVYIELTVTKIS